MEREVTAALKGRLRRSSVYRYWRLYRAQEQRSSFERLQEAVLAEDAVASPGALAERLKKVAPQRRAPKPGERSSVIAFGAHDWEDRGLWQALSEAGEFHLVDKMAPRRGPWVSKDSEQRKKLGDLFLRQVEEREREGHEVHWAFLYAGGTEISPEAIRELRRRGIWTVMMCLDDKQLLPGPRFTDLEGWQLEVAREVDIYWTTWRSGADWLTREGVNAWYAPEAADPHLFAPAAGVERTIDVLWIGSAYGYRKEFVDQLRRRGLRVMARGAGWEDGPVSFDEMLSLLHRSKLTLGIGGVGHGDDIRCLKGRDFEFPMSGAVYLTGFNPELTDHFEIGNEILCYHNIIDCAETAHWILRRPERAERIRTAARRRCVRDHSWLRRIEDLQALLGFRSIEGLHEARD